MVEYLQLILGIQLKIRLEFLVQQVVSKGTTYRPGSKSMSG